MSEPPRVRFATATEWAEWLAEFHADSPGIWLEIGKARSAVRTVSYAAALDVALCFGWIDGQKRSVDDTTWLQRFSPRGPRSRWSKVNREKANALIAAGRMHQAGLEEVERAKRDGRWEAAYDSPRTATVPPDLSAALDADPAARAFFATLDSRNRYSILHRVQAARRPETRARLIDKYVAMLHNGERLHP